MRKYDGIEIPEWVENPEEYAAVARDTMRKLWEGMPAWMRQDWLDLYLADIRRGLRFWGRCMKEKEER